MKTTLGVICDVDWGNTSLTKKSYLENGKFLAVSAKGCDGRIDHYEHDEDVCVLSAIGAQCGKMFFPQQKFTAIKNTITLKPKKELVEGKFLYYLFSSINLPIRGAAQPFIAKGDIEKFEIDNLPNIKQQQRILVILDTLFAKIDNLININLEKEKNISSIYEASKNKIFNSISNYDHKKLKDVCEKITDGTHQTPKYFDKGYVFLSSKNVKSKIIDWEKIKYIDEKQHLEMQKRVSPKKGDILLAKNGTTGMAAIVDKDIPFDIYVSLALLRSTGDVLPEYLLEFINSKAANEQFSERTKGIGVQNLHLQEIREVLIKYPKSKIEQKNIIKKNQYINTKYKELLFLEQKKISNLRALKLAILTKEIQVR